MDWICEVTEKDFFFLIGKMDAMEHLLWAEGDHELSFGHVEFRIPLRYIRNYVNWADVWTNKFVYEWYSKSNNIHLRRFFFSVRLEEH